MSQPYRQGMPPMEQPVQPSAGEQQNNPQGRQITQAEKEMGIHYEPISSMFGGQNSPVDQAGQFPDAFPPAPAESITQTPQTNTVPDSLTATLVSWIQNERNGALFYEHLAAVSGDSDRRRLLHDIADTSRRHSQLFNTIYKERKGTGYEVRETGVETGVGFREGLRWAIREESKAVKELADLAEKPELDGVYRSLNAALCRKLSDLALLSSLAVM